MRPNSDDFDNVCALVLAHLAMFWFFSYLWGSWILIPGIFVTFGAAIKTLAEIK